MSDLERIYDWADYYEQAYKAEKQKNRVLAGKIADLEVKQSDLQFKLDRIHNNKLWKLSAPARGLWHKAQNLNTNKDTAGMGLKDDACFLRYEKEVYLQKHPYLQWIREKEFASTCLKGKFCIVSFDLTRQDFDFDKEMEKIENPETTYILFSVREGLVAAGADGWIEDYFRENPTIRIAYGDEDFYWKETKNRMHPWFKPDWSPNTFLAFNYFGNGAIVRADLAKEISWNKQEDAAISLYDFLCRACMTEGVLPAQLTTKECKVGHIRRILFHTLFAYQITEEQKEANRNFDELQIVENALEKAICSDCYIMGCQPEYSQVKMDLLQRMQVKAKLESAQDPSMLHVVYEVPDATKISAVILSKDHPEVLQVCLESLYHRTEYSNLEVIVVDNGSLEENKEKVLKLQEEYGFHYLYEPMEFNFSAMCNLGAKAATGDLLLLMNDDVEVLEKDWLKVMAGQALRPDTGAVGARLLYANTLQIQHAGITNLTIGPSHKLVTFEDDVDYYYGRNRLTYDMLGVTAACLLVDKSKFNQVGGLQEEMKVSYNDVDLCFKLAEAGYHNVLRNDAVLYHYESLTRGLDEMDDEKWNRLLCEKERLYFNHKEYLGNDPYYHPELVDNASDYVCNQKFDHENHLKTERIRQQNERKIAKTENEHIKLTIDHAILQRKIHNSEPEICWIDGWCYVEGADNSQYSREILLRSQDDLIFAITPAARYRKDVEAILPSEKFISLAGLSVRILKEDLTKGEYRIGIRYFDSAGRSKGVAWSDKTLTIS